MASPPGANREGAGGAALRGRGGLRTILLMAVAGTILATIVIRTHGCTGSDVGPASSRPLDVSLGWQANANSIGQIAALEKGFYREVGLDVRLHPGGLTQPSLHAVASGQHGIG